MCPALHLRFLHILFLSILLAVGCTYVEETTPNLDFRNAIQKAKPAVVLIKAIHERKLRDSAIEGGSGVIISEDGYIVTNNHVIDKANKIEVTLDDNRRYVATIMGTDPTTDLTLLKIEATNLHYLSFGDSTKLKVGDWVLAVGNPFNLTFTVTKGIVSAINRGFGFDKNHITDFIQTDAVTNPGSSGGALINLQGELVGITSSSISTTGAFIGYSLAIPSVIIQRTIIKLKQDRTVQHVMLGILPLTVNGDLVEEKKLKRHYGVYVQALAKPSPAVEAGMQEGDIIITVDGIKIENLPQLYEQLINHGPEDCVTVIVDRGGEELSIPITLRKALETSKKTGVWSKNK